VATVVPAAAVLVLAVEVSQRQVQAMQEVIALPRVTQGEQAVSLTQAAAVVVLVRQEVQERVMLGLLEMAVTEVHHQSQEPQ
jgi:hypothetical protein